eukprot:193664-Pelagomonas_calceolata.AAC.2
MCETSSCTGAANHPTPSGLQQHKLCNCIAKFGWQFVDLCASRGYLGGLQCKNFSSSVLTKAATSQHFMGLKM